MNESSKDRVRGPWSPGKSRDGIGVGQAKEDRAHDASDEDDFGLVVDAVGVDAVDLALTVRLGFDRGGDVEALADFEAGEISRGLCAARVSAASAEASLLCHRSNLGPDW